MRCKIVRTQKFMWHNFMSSTKSQKASILHYSIDNRFKSVENWSLDCGALSVTVCHFVLF
jgi:hypothetical protein